MATLTLKNVVKRYGETTAVHGFDLEVKDQEFIVLVGPSGCGKSTTLRMVAGLESISDGTVAIDGRTVNDVAAQDRDIAMVFQNYALYPHMSVRDNIAFGLKMRRRPKGEIEERVQEAAGLLQIDHLLDRKPAALSGGQRQRVAMGRAIVRHPKVFLMDEPLSNLDAKLRVDMRWQIKALHERLGATILYVTHDQIEAMTLGDRIVVMKDGYVMQIGTPMELYNHPANVFVAGFIGNPGMNFVPVAAQGGALTHAGSELLRGLDAPARALLGIRPEHLSLEEEEAGGGRIAGKVALVEPLGGQTQVVLDKGESRLTARLDGQPQLRAGEPLTLHFAPERVHLFDAETEEALPTATHTAGGQPTQGAAPQSATEVISV